MKTLFVMVVLFVLLVLPVGAQDEVGCTAEQYENGAAVLIETLNQLATDENPYNILLGIEMTIDLLRYECFGEGYNSELYPNGIVGPAMFQGTLYQATLSSPDGFGSVAMTAIEGDCGLTFPLSTDIEGGEETDLWEFGGDCIALFEVNAPGAWTLDIQRLQ